MFALLLTYVPERLFRDGRRGWHRLPLLAALESVRKDADALHRAHPGRGLLAGRTMGRGGQRVRDSGHLQDVC